MGAQPVVNREQASVTGSKPSMPEAHPVDKAVNPTHERILQCALSLFAERGFHGTGIRDIASGAGISTANLYHYGSKEKILLQVMTRALERLLTAAQTIADQGGQPLERLDNLVRMHVITHALSPEASSVVDDQVGALGGEDRETIIGLRDQYEKFYADCLSEGIDRGLITVPDATAARLGILEMCSGVARWFSPTGRFSATTIADIHVDLVRAMINAAPSDTAGCPSWLISTIESIWPVSLGESK